jgi:hypothetical protein
MEMALSAVRRISSARRFITESTDNLGDYRTGAPFNPKIFGELGCLGEPQGPAGGPAAREDRGARPGALQ